MKLIVYGAKWCQPCQQLKNIISQFDFGEVQVDVLDVDELGREVLMKVQVKGVPTLIVQDNQGNEIKRKTGALTKEQLQLFLGLDRN